VPTATPFTALADGDGGLCSVPAFDCTIGRADGNPSFSRIIEDYITLGGHRGSTGGRASESQIRKSFINAMKIIWNFHGVDVSGGLTSASAFSSQDFNRSYTKVGGGDPPTRTPLSWSISTSAEVSASKSFPSVDIESNEPISRVCNRFSGSSSSFFVDEGEVENDVDTGEDTSDGITIFGQSRAALTLSGVGVGPPYGYSFRASSPGVAAFFDNGVFVGYGCFNLFDDASYEVSVNASGGGSEQPSSSVFLVCGFSLGGVTYEGEVTGGLNPDNIETKKTTFNGIPFLSQAGYYEPNDGQIEMSFTGKTATFVGTGSTLDGNTQTTTLPDTSAIENYVQTNTITNRSQFNFKFRINGLDFYTY